METVTDFIYLGSKITADGDCSHEIKRCFLLKSYDKPREHIKKQRHYFADKDPSSQSYDFSSSHVWMWGLDHKEGWAPKNWCFWTVVFEKTLESFRDCKEIKPVNPEGNQSWIFIGRTNVEAEAPILWPPDGKSRLIGKDPEEGLEETWGGEGHEEKGTTEDEMVGWHHQLDRYEFEQAPGDGEGQGSLVCCSPWSCKESNMTDLLNNNNKISVFSDNGSISHVQNILNEICLPLVIRKNPSFTIRPRFKFLTSNLTYVVSTSLYAKYIDGVYIPTWQNCYKDRFDVYKVLTHCKLLIRWSFYYYEILPKLNRW